MSYTTEALLPVPTPYGRLPYTARVTWDLDEPLDAILPRVAVVTADPVAVAWLEREAIPAGRRLIYATARGLLAEAIAQVYAARSVVEPGEAAGEGELSAGGLGLTQGREAEAPVGGRHHAEPDPMVDGAICDPERGAHLDHAPALLNDLADDRASGGATTGARSHGDGMPEPAPGVNRPSQ